MKDEILSSLKELSGNRKVVTIVGVILLIVILVIGASVMQSCSAPEYPEDDKSGSVSTQGDGTTSTLCDPADAMCRVTKDGSATRTNVPKEEKETAAPGAVIPGDQNYQVTPKSKGSGTDHVTGPPAKSIPISKAAFPGGFPLPEGTKVISSKTQGKTSTVRFWLADPTSAAKFYEDALPDSELYVDAQNISVDSLMAYFKFSGDGYSRDGGTLSIKGSTATLVWTAPADVVVDAPTPKKPAASSKRADK